jgi:HSP20 family protein
MVTKRNKKWLPSKWDPFMSNIFSFKKSFDEMFNNFFLNHPSLTKLPSLWKGKLDLWKPEIDMYETDKEIVVKANVPGCDKKDIKVNIDNNILTISGEKKEEREVKKKNFYQKEQQFGTFQRSISLPHYADTEKVKASCEKGILKIVFPKTKTPRGKGKKIDIS